jgi:hypothetical protein
MPSSNNPKYPDLKYHSKLIEADLKSTGRSTFWLMEARERLPILLVTKQWCNLQVYRL